MELANNFTLCDLAKILQLPYEHLQSNAEPEQRKSLVERAIRSKALQFGGTVPKVAEVSAFVKLVVDIAKQEICSKTVTIQILQDIFDVSAVNCCERLFEIVEDNIDTWKTPFFFDSCKNLVLRMCNDLLKRLSRTVDTTFCGRILMLLANFLPFTEKSGLNLTGQFNTHNVTTYDREKKEQPLEETHLHQTPPTIAVAADDDVEVGEIREHRNDLSGAISVDYNLYVKFWALQKFFANPNLLFEYNAFKNFHAGLSEIFSIFSTNKLEELAGGNGGVHQQQPTTEQQQPHHFFAKYLTSQKLFPLQLADSQFRRYLMLQYLIIANYLLLKVKLKDTFTLTALQEEEVRELVDKCVALLRETQPNGSLFADAVKKVLGRERLWSAWKNEGCPDLITPLLNAQAIAKYTAFKRKAPLCQQFVQGQLDLGNKELTRLWNIQPNNLFACKEQQRKCTPELVQFLADALDEMDPEQQVDEQYQSVNEETYQWMGSRFLLLTSDQFLSSNAQDSSRMPSSTSTSATATSTSTAFFLKKTIQMTAENVPALKERAEQIQLALKKRENAERSRLAAEAKELEKIEKKIAAAAKIAEEEEQLPTPQQQPQQRKKKDAGSAAAVVANGTSAGGTARGGEEATVPLATKNGRATTVVMENVATAAERKKERGTGGEATTTEKRKGGGDTATAEKERKRESSTDTASERKKERGTGGETTTSEKRKGGGETAAEKERKREDEQHSADRRIKRRRERTAEKPKKRRTDEESVATFT